MKKKCYYYDLHCHTVGSIDSPLHLEDAVKTAKERGLDGIAVTDHDNICEGPLNMDGIEIIPGTEVTLKGGDHLLGYFVKKEVEIGLDMEEAIFAIKKQGGYAVWAHPLRRREVLTVEEKKSLSYLDGVETGNAMDEKEKRERVSEIAKKYSLLETAGSDAHMTGQVGTGVLKTKERITKENFPRVIREGEIIIRREMDGYRKTNSKWKKRMRWIRSALRLNTSRRTKTIFAKVVIRNYVRLNNLKLKKVKFNLKEEGC